MVDKIEAEHNPVHDLVPVPSANHSMDFSPVDNIDKECNPRLNLQLDSMLMSF